jgi:NitT/TauT family transport system substrate-binding protein
VIRWSASLTIFACVIVSASACGRRSAAPGGTVRIAIGGQNQLIYLPTTLARELGFYRDEGLTVELQDFAGGSKALEALMGGSADVVSGFYDHTVQMAAEGRELVAFVTMLRVPGLVLAVSPQNRDAVKKIEDLRDKIAGVTSLGSSSHMLLSYLLKRHGVDPDSVHITSVGTAGTAIAAVEHGKVAAAMMTEPAFTVVSRRTGGVGLLADLRDGNGVRREFGTSTYPASVLYSSAVWIRDHRTEAGQLARAIVRTLDWIQTHSPEDIAAKSPPAFRGDDPAVYVDAIRHSRGIFSPDGRMTPEGAEAVHALLRASMDKVRNATVDLSKTYTNEFLERQ